jgi:hypothetical protein
MYGRNLTGGRKCRASASYMLRKVEGGQIALFFIHCIFLFSQSAVFQYLAFLCMGIIPTFRI